MANKIMALDDRLRELTATVQEQVTAVQVLADVVDHQMDHTTTIVEAISKMQDFLGYAPYEPERPALKLVGCSTSPRAEHPATVPRRPAG